MIFQLSIQVNGHEAEVTAEPWGRIIAVRVAGDVRRARSVSEAESIAADALGPLLRRAQDTGSSWGLYVSAGGASAVFGEWIPGTQAPVLRGPEAKPTSRVSELFGEWQRHDGSPVGALNAAMKIIAAYAERPHRAAA